MIRALLLAALTLGAMMSTANAQGLSDAQWEARPLLLFAPTADNALLTRQLAILAEDRPGVKDRRLAVYVVAGQSVAAQFGAPSVSASADTLRARYSVPADAFRVVLIGLDGGAKLARDEPIAAQSLFATIDGMPMRRQELRRRGQDG